jgi:hypothetical protein
LEGFQQLGGEHTLPPVVQPVAVQFGVDDVERARFGEPDWAVLLREIERDAFAKRVPGNRDRALDALVAQRVDEQPQQVVAGLDRGFEPVEDLFPLLG